MLLRQILTLKLSNHESIVLNYAAFIQDGSKLHTT